MSIDSIIKNKPASLSTVFDYCTDKEIKLLRKSSSTVNFKKGEPIFKNQTPSENVLFLEKGLVKLYSEKEFNNTLILSLISPFNLIEQDVFSENHNHRYSAAALEASEVVYINWQVFNEIINQNNRIACYLLNSLSQALSFVNERLCVVTQKQLNGRVADTLLFFTDFVYYNDSFTVPLTRVEFAQFVGASRVNVNRIMLDFKNDDIIDFDKERITVKNRQMLELIKENG